MAAAVVGAIDQEVGRPQERISPKVIFCGRMAHDSAAGGGVQIRFQVVLVALVARLNFTCGSTNLDHAGGTSAGGFRTNSIAFGTLPLWTSTRVNDGSYCRFRN